jgi:TolA-binding protein
MAQAKLTKRELKEDEFLNTSERVIRYVSLHPKPFIWGGALVFLLMAALFLARMYFERYEAKASRALYAANEAYQENLALASPDSPYERRGTPDFEKPLKLYQEVIAQFPRSGAATEALYQTAQSLHHLSRLDEAIPAYQKYLGRTPRGKLSIMAALGLGNCYEQKSDLARAAEVYATAIGNNPHDSLLGEVLVSLGRCQEATGKKEEAIKTYTQVTEKFPNSTWKSYAERKLLYLKSH